MEAAETLLSSATQCCFDEQNEMPQDGPAEDPMDTVSVRVQTDLTRLDNLLFSNELHESKQKILALEDSLHTNSITFTKESVLQDSETSKRFIQFYTGLPNARVLHTIFDYVAPSESSKTAKLSPFEEFMMTLMKLRLNSPMQDLAFRFGVSRSTVAI